MEKATAYLKSAVSELRKVTWPTKTQTINYSIVVIAMSIGVALFFGLFDYILNILLGLVL
jgi:preprotein translocase subunit SecE